MNLGIKPSAFATSRKSADVVVDQFPAGLRVLVVDDDLTCLTILERMLRSCLYEVTKCNRAEIALSLLRDNRNGYDVVISDVHMPDMDGFKLLEHVGLEMDLPVIMMSADDKKDVVMKGVIHGACDYFIKPVRMEALKNIWQHVVRKKRHQWKEKDYQPSGSVEGERLQQNPSEDVDYSSSANEGSWKNPKKRKDEEDESEDRDDTSSLKKPRVVWSVELHQQFVAAVNQLGIDKAVPKKILESMNVAGITRENVASHLQKYRLYLRRLSGVSTHQNGVGNSFMGPMDPIFGPLPSINGFDLQALAASGQLPPQSLATIQAAALGGRATTSKSSTLVDQRNIFSFENPRLQNNNGGEQVNLLHGIPTNMDSKKLANLHQSAQSFNNMSQSNNPLLAQMVHQPQSRMHVLNEINGTHHVSVVHGTAYNNSVSKPLTTVDFSRSQSTKLSVNNNFAVVSNNSGMSNLTCIHQEEVSLAVKGTTRGAIVPNYDVFNDLNQNRGPYDWDLQSVGSNIQGRTGVPSSVLVRPGGFSSNQKSGLNSSSSTENSLRVKTEKLPDMGFQNGLCPEQFGQDDLMNALLKQQEGIGPMENVFGFDGYHLDNLPVLNTNP